MLPAFQHFTRFLLTVFLVALMNQSAIGQKIHMHEPGVYEKNIKIFLNESRSTHDRVDAAKKVHKLNLITPPKDLKNVRKVFFDEGESEEVRLAALDLMLYTGTLEIPDIVKYIKNSYRDPKVRSLSLPLLAESWNEVGPYSGMQQDAQDNIAEVIQWSMQSETKAIEVKGKEAFRIMEREKRFADFKDSLFPIPKETAVEDMFKMLEDRYCHPVLKAKCVRHLDEMLFYLARNSYINPADGARYQDILTDFVVSEAPEDGDSLMVHLDKLRWFLFMDQIFPIPKSPLSIGEAMNFVDSPKERPSLRRKCIESLGNLTYTMSMTGRMTRGELKRMDRLMRRLSEDADTMISKPAEKALEVVENTRRVKFRNAVINSDSANTNMEDALTMLRNEEEDPEFRAQLIELFGENTVVLEDAGELEEGQFEKFVELATELQESEDSILSKAAQPALNRITNLKFKEFTFSIFPNPANDSVFYQAVEMIMGEAEPFSYRKRCLIYLGEHLALLKSSDKIDEGQTEQVLTAMRWGAASEDSVLATKMTELLKAFESNRLSELKAAIYPQPRSHQAILDIEKAIKNPEEEMELRTECLSFVCQNLSVITQPGKVADSSRQLLFGLINWAKDSGEVQLQEIVQKYAGDFSAEKLKTFQRSIYPNPESENSISDAISMIMDSVESLEYRATCLSYLLEKFNLLQSSKKISPEDQKKVVQLAEWAANSKYESLENAAAPYMASVYDEKLNAFAETVYPSPKNEKSIAEALNMIEDETENPFFRAACLSLLCSKMELMAKGNQLKPSEINEIMSLIDRNRTKEPFDAVIEQQQAAINGTRFHLFQANLFPKLANDSSLYDAVMFIRSNDAPIAYRTKCFSFLADKLGMILRVNPDNITDNDKLMVFDLFDWAGKQADSTMQQIAVSKSEEIREVRYKDFCAQIFPNLKEAESFSNAIDLIKDKKTDPELRARCLTFLGEKAPMMARYKGLNESQIEEVGKVIEWARKSGPPALKESAEELLKTPENQ